MAIACVILGYVLASMEIWKLCSVYKGSIIRNGTSGGCLLPSPSEFSDMPSDMTLMKYDAEKLDQASDEGNLPDSDHEELVVDALEEKQLVRKLDQRIMPITCMLYLFACSYFSKLRVSVVFF